MRLCVLTYIEHILHCTCFSCSVKDEAIGSDEESDDEITIQKPPKGTDEASQKGKTSKRAVRDIMITHRMPHTLIQLMAVGDFNDLRDGSISRKDSITVPM